MQQADTIHWMTFATPASATRGPSRTREPEQRLMLAVLEDAIARFRSVPAGDSAGGRRDLFEVRRWMGSRDLESPFSFENICAALGVDADYLREGLEAARLRDLEDSASAPRRRLRRDSGHDDKTWRRGTSRRDRT